MFVFAPIDSCCICSSLGRVSSCDCSTMPVVQVTLHPRGLHPLEAARAFHLHEEEGVTLRDICKEVTNMSGERPSAKAVWNAVRMVNTITCSFAMPCTHVFIISLQKPRKTQAFPTHSDPIPTPIRPPKRRFVFLLVLRPLARNAKGPQRKQRTRSVPNPTLEGSHSNLSGRQTLRILSFRAYHLCRPVTVL